MEQNYLLETALRDFRSYLQQSKQLTPSVINSYISWTKKAFENAENITHPIAINKQSLEEAKKYSNSEPKNRTLSNIQSALRRFEKFLSEQSTAENRSIKGPVLVKLSRQAYKVYLTEVYRKEDGKPLTANTINDYASKVTRISKVNIYDTWNEVEPLCQALDKIQDDEQFNAIDNGGCKASLSIFINCIEDVLAGKFKSSEVHVLMITGKLL